MSLAIIVKDEIGGVSRYSLNLYKYLKQINILTNIIVLKNINENLSFPIAKEIELNDLIIFTYDDCCNIHFTAIEFSKLLKKREIQLIVANDSFELQLLQITKLFIKVIFVLHGDYKHYYATSLFNQHIIDLHLCVSNEIYHNLRSEITGEIEILNPIIKKPIFNNVVKSENSICFIGRDDNSKGFDIINELINRTQHFDIEITWHLILSGTEKQFEERENVRYYWNIENEQVREVLLKSSFFILPSMAEGFPISIIEALYFRNICITSNLEVLNQLLNNNKIGITIKNHQVEEYWEALVELINSKEKQNNYLNFINIFNMDEYLKIDQGIEKIIKLNESLIIKEKLFQYQEVGFLDKKNMPNFISKCLKKLKKHLLY